MKKNVKHMIAKMICLSLVLSGLQVYHHEQRVRAYTTHSVDEAISWAASKVGQSLEGDNYYGYDNKCAYQCVDFIMCYYKYLGVTPATGNGCDYATNALPAGWTRVKGGQPQKGDILVYSANVSNKAGHVAIYESEHSTYHQNFGDCKKVTHETYRYNGFSNPYWGYIRPDWTTAHNPFGCVDVCESKVSGKLHIRGWAIDEDNYGAQLDIHVYIGSENDAIGYNTGAANTERADVDNAYHCGKYHGFDKTIDTDRTGNQRVRIFAINVGGGDNKLLYDRTVNIVSDNEKPESDGYIITALNEHGYTISGSCYDNIGVTKVKIAIKSEDDPSDLVWYEGDLDESLGGYSSWKFTYSDGMTEKKYATDVYMYDAAGNCTSFSVAPVKLGKDTEKPVINSSSIYQETPGIVNLKLNVSDNYGLGKITRFQSYCFSNDKNSGKFLGYDMTIAQEDCWSLYVNCKPIVLPQKITEAKVQTFCDGIIGYSVSVSDLAGNSYDDKFVWIDGVEVKGLEGNSEEIVIGQGETIKVKEIGVYNSAYNVVLDSKNERILKKNNIDDYNHQENIELIGNEEGVEYVYFMNLLTGHMRSCRIVVKSSEDVGDGIVSTMESESEATASPSPTSGENNATLTPTVSPQVTQTDEPQTTPDVTSAPTPKPDTSFAPEATPFATPADDNPTIAPETTSTPIPMVSDAPQETATPKPADTPLPIASDVPQATATPKPTVTPTPTKAPTTSYDDYNNDSSSVSVKKPSRVTGLFVHSKKGKKVEVIWKWKRNVSGFQIQYALNKKFNKGKKTKKVGAYTSYKTFKGFKKGKTYYFRVRAFNKKSGQTKYGAWSSVKSCRIK